MSKRSIMKDLDSEVLMLTQEGLEKNYARRKRTKLNIKACSLLFLGVFVLACSGLLLNNLKIKNIETGETFSLVTPQVAATASKKDVISIPTGIVKANPFVPYRKLGNEIQLEPSLINDVPKYDLIAPPESLEMNPEVTKIMSTTVSGILYDKFSPSAILNIDGSDYLVKKGDTIHKYKVIAIEKDSVTVKTGNNTYTAGIGQLLTDGSVNRNDVSNLSKKFGGEKR